MSFFYYFRHGTQNYMICLLFCHVYVTLLPLPSLSLSHSLASFSGDFDIFLFSSLFLLSSLQRIENSLNDLFKRKRIDREAPKNVHKQPFDIVLRNFNTRQFHIHSYIGSASLSFVGVACHPPPLSFSCSLEQSLFFILSSSGSHFMNVKSVWGKQHTVEIEVEEKERKKWRE